MYLDDVVRNQKRGETTGVTSICSAHPWVLATAMRLAANPLLIEATCNQVNQFGGYTGMTPADFARYVRGLAEKAKFPFENIILGGDHLGPNVWQSESADSAMQKAAMLIKAYVQAGFVKIHLDCSMRLGDDPNGALDVELAAKRAAQLAKVAESCAADGNKALRYVIGTEVPIPGGAYKHEAELTLTEVESARQTVEVTLEAFSREGLEAAWERVIALVVQPGVEFGDDFVEPYRPDAARALSRFIASQPIVYEAHSTDFQTPAALKSLVRDQFAFLKVGPRLTFAFREAVFALAMIETEIIAEDQRSRLIPIVDSVMMKYPEYWKAYYRGNATEQAYQRKYSLSDRIRYYWAQPEVNAALERLLRNLGDSPLPYSLLSQFVGVTDLNAVQLIEWKIRSVLDDYWKACND